MQWHDGRRITGPRRMRSLAEHRTYEERLRLRLQRCGPDAAEAAIALMERYDPDSLATACDLLLGEGTFPPGCGAVVVDAWDRYFHMKAMPWD